MEKFKVKINSSEKIEILLQEIYDQACKHLNEIQNEINKLIANTNLGNEDITMDDKAKYSKALHDYFSDKNKAISSKFDIAKFLGEILKNNGDLDATINSENLKKTTKFDFKALKETLAQEIKSDTTKTYKIK